MEERVLQQVAERNPSATPTPATLLSMAVSQGADLDRLEKLMELQAKWEANEARKAYVAAMSAFKADPPKILKDKHVRFETKKGVTEYKHATLFAVTNAINAALSNHELSATWDIEQGNRIKVACIITHAKGHSERVEMSATADESGGKNSIQAIASTVSYLERYTLLAATGLAAQDMDDDGRGSEPIEKITEDQVANLVALIDEVEADQLKFMQYLKVNRLKDIPAEWYPKAVTLLEAKRGA